MLNIMTNKHAKALGSLGGKARAKRLTKEQRITIAKKGGKARWKIKENLKTGMRTVEIKHGGKVYRNSGLGWLDDMLKAGIIKLIRERRGK